VNGDERFWPARLRWRLRGAWMWPAFIVLTLVDGLILHLLPPLRFGFSEVGLDLIAGILIAMFGNLFLVGAISPWLSRRMVRRRRAHGETALPEQVMREVVNDRVGTTLLALGLVGVLASGLASIPLINGETDDRNRAARALVDFVHARAPAEIQRNNDQGGVETARLADGYFRSCVPFDDRRSYWCVFIDTNSKPPRVVKDPSSEANKRDEVR
jgi:hypothetical protein